MTAIGVGIARWSGVHAGCEAVVRVDGSWGDAVGRHERIHVGGCGVWGDGGRSWIASIGVGADHAFFGTAAFFADVEFFDFFFVSIHVLKDD